MVRCKDYSVTQVRIDMHRVGIVGLADALEAAAESGLEERSAIEDLLLDTVAARNYVPADHVAAYRRALWREFERHRGRDISPYFDDVHVTVRGPAGESRDRFVTLLAAVLAEFELRPLVHFEGQTTGDSALQLDLAGDTILRGMPTRRTLRSAIYRSFSDW